MSKNKHSNYLDHDDYQLGLPHEDNNQSNVGHELGTYNTENQSTRNTSSRVLFWCMILTFSFAIVEGIGGYLVHSIALQADAVHMLTDAAGLFIAYIANKISRKPATTHLSFGYGKAEALGALINCIFTSVLTLGLIWQVLARFFAPVDVHGAGLFILASVGMFVNGLVVLVLSKNANSLNTKAALIHALGDLLGSAIAIIAGIVIYFTDFNLIDPILSLIVITILISSNYRLIVKSSRVLMAGVPENIDYEEVGRSLEAINGVLNVHDLHIWYMSANNTALSAHVVAQSPYTWQQTLLSCQKMLRDKYNITHVTLQHEFNPHKYMQGYCEVR